ncbi:MAG TPA: hypothetical protein VHG72_21940 [Polyangia bacterium]|nr:hypothetical protein [Polyangia bacterium]
MDQATKDEIVAKLRVTLPGVDLYEYSSESAGKFFVHRRAMRGERIIYHKLIAEKKTLDAMDCLMGCVLYPDKEQLQKELDAAPFVINGLADRIVAESGIYEDAISRKL